MIYKRASAICLAVFLFISAANAQKAEVSVGLNEAFFDALLDSIFLNFDPLEFSMAETAPRRTKSDNGVRAASNSFVKKSECKETIKVLREMNGVRTAVRFRNGKILVPIAFSGSYSPPLVGCVEFAGWAEANLDLEVDREGQRLTGRARVLNVNLNGTGGIGSSVVARLVQRSIDKKINPIEIIRLDKLSFALPIRDAGNLRMRALGARHEVTNGVLVLTISYEFVKG